MSNPEDDARRKALSPILGVRESRPLSSTVRVDIGVQSHPGLERTRNEDHYLVVRQGRNQETLATSLSSADVPPRFDESLYAMLVADGLGEGGAGSVASRVALSTIAQLAVKFGRWNVRIDPKNVSEVFERSVWLYDQADRAILDLQIGVPELANMATTLTAAFSAGDDLFVAHVGHSRAYLFRNGNLTSLTRDHTIERHLADTGKPASVERRGQDQGHILTDALGARGDHPVIEVEHFRLRDGDHVLLSTNGLTDMVSDGQIADILALRRRPAELAQMLVDLALKNGGKDNITALVAEYQIPAAPRQ